MTRETHFGLFVTARVFDASRAWYKKTNNAEHLDRSALFVFVLCRKIHSCPTVVPPPDALLYILNSNSAP